MPVLNLMLYWGTGKWENPLNLRDMTEDLSSLPERLRELVGDYKVHLVSMRGISEDDLQKMHSDLKYVLGIMKRTKSRKRYEEYILENREFFSRIPKSAVDVIDACTNIKDIRDSLDFTLNQETGEKEADMCKALTDLKKDAVRRGLKQGVKKGMAQGIAQGITQGITQGIEQGIEQGIAQGITQGIEQATRRTNKLIELLLEDGRQEDLLRSARDTLFQKKLFKEYNI